MDSIYFRNPNGQLLEMACFKFAPPEGYTVADVLSTAHRLRVAAGDYAINESHLADAIAELVERKGHCVSALVSKAMSEVLAQAPICGVCPQRQ